MFSLSPLTLSPYFLPLPFPPLQHGGDDALRFVITEIEELMFLFIVLYGERYQVGVGEGMSQEDSIRRELIHLLYLGPLPHSQILKKFKVTSKFSYHVYANYSSLPPPV